MIDTTRDRALSRGIERLLKEHAMADDAIRIDTTAMADDAIRIERSQLTRLAEIELFAQAKNITVDSAIAILTCYTLSGDEGVQKMIRKQRARNAIAEAQREEAAAIERLAAAAAQKADDAEMSAGWEWQPTIRELSQMTGFEWEFEWEISGGTRVLRAMMAGVTIRISDVQDGTLTAPPGKRTNGISIGFTLPDAPWTGRTESLIHVIDAVTSEEIAEVTCLTIADYLRGRRVSGKELHTLASIRDPQHKA